MKKNLTDLLPWYENGTLDQDEKTSVDDLLVKSEFARQELEDWRVIGGAVTAQPLQKLNPQLWLSISANLKPVRTPWLVNVLTHQKLLASFVLLFGFMLGMWLAIRPGVVLEWTVSSLKPKAFNVYRAPVGSEDFKLIGNVPAVSEPNSYRFVDPYLWPFQRYIYRVEGIGASGRLAVSHPITTNSLAAFPGQLSIFLSSLLLTFMVIKLVQNWPAYSLSSRKGLPA